MALLPWENSGPDGLDLATPLAEGVKAGQSSKQESDLVNYRQQQNANEQQKIDYMNAALGLQQKQEAFEETKFNSMADMRSTDLDLARSNLVAQTRMNDTAANDKQTLLDAHGTLDDLVAKNDYAGLSNATPPGGLSASGMQAWQQMKAGYMQGAAATQALAQTNATNGTILQYSQAFGKPLTNADGTPNVAGMTQALTQRDIDLKKTEAANSATALAAATRAQASMYGTDTRAATSRANIDKTTAASILNYQQKNYAQAKNYAGGKLPPDQDAYFQGQIQHAQEMYDNAVTPGQAAPVNPVNPQINTTVPNVHKILKGLPGVVDIANPATSPTNPGMIQNPNDTTSVIPISTSGAP